MTNYKRIFLMNPPSGLYRRDDRCQSKVEDQTVRVVFPPIELGVLAAIARGWHGHPAREQDDSAFSSNGNPETDGSASHPYPVEGNPETGSASHPYPVDVALKDYPTVGGTPQDYINDIREFRPDFILLNTTVHTLAEDLQAFAIAREFFPHVRTVIKGEAVAIQAERVLEKHHELDVVLDGEPEIPMRDLVAGKPLAEIGNIVWRDPDGHAHRNEQLPFIENLDDIPLPARDLFDNSLYRSPENGRKITAIYAQRGCPSKCIFCPAGTLYDFKVRERSVTSVVDEIQECVQRHGIRDFLFHGDTFTLHKKWLINLCKEILDRGLDVHWGCNSRVDTIDDERAEWMRKAGCWVVAFGFEHGSQEILDKMKKGARVEKAHDAVSVCRRNGLQIHGFFVIGMPWETHKTLQETYDFVKTLDTDYFDFNIAYPLPGTEYYDIVQRDNLFEVPDPLSGSYSQAAVRTYALTSEELTEWRRKALFRMYRRPAWIYRTIKNAAAAGNTGHYAKEAWFRMNHLLKTKRLAVD